MKTRIVKIEDIKQQRDILHESGEILRSGGLVAFPTETVYGLGANGLDGEACAGIYAAKGRPSDNPLILHVANRSMVEQIAVVIPPLAEKLMAAFCPGPITLIMQRKAIVPDRITGGLPTVGIRMPENDVARALIRAAGVPIAAPSANISGRPSPSTIVDCTGDQAGILRPGAITREMLVELLGEDMVILDPALVGADVVPKAPGMKYTHYAPKAPLTLIEGMPTRMARAFQREVTRLQGEGHVVGVIASHEVLNELRGLLPANLMADYGHQGSLPAIAANIYEALRSFDDQPADVLLGEGTAEQGLGLAIMNRLHKASGFRTIRA